MDQCKCLHDHNSHSTVDWCLIMDCFCRQFDPIAQVEELPSPTPSGQVSGTPIAPELVVDLPSDEVLDSLELEAVEA